jgi:3-hydroxyisobutyrate dehydrogenase-like beta-hydroxyacid dehydrogenase
MRGVALLGTGHLGSGFAEGLLTRGGVELTVWNRTRSKAEPFGSRGARVADSPADAVRGAELVHLVLLDDATVDATVAAIRPALQAKAIIIDHTTNSPARTAERSHTLASAGVAYLHAPVFMSPAAARDAQGIMMVAGSRELFARVEGALRAMTGDLWYVGERPDLAAAYKLFGNAMILTVAAGLADVFHMADGLGVPRADAFGVFNHLKVEGGMSVRGTKIVQENYDATFTLETARKDARLMLEAAGSESVPMLTALAARMDDVIAKGLGGLDMAVLAKRGV